MNKKRLLAYVLFAFSFCGLGITLSAEELPAFPGAEGHGRYTTGGRGGDVYHVTNLNDRGTGSLRYALLQKGKRTIVFDVAGTIHLESELKINNGDLTIAGQTAPGDGICIADYPVKISANNIIIRYLRFRMGNGSGQEDDALGGWDRQNIIIDHCSVSWSVDECMSVYGSDNLTVQWCIVSESLRTAGHGKGAHGYGGNWGGAKASYHHNLMAHHDSRCPRLGPKAGTQTREYMDLRNNVFYNWSGNGCYGGEGMKVNIVNNYYKPGPATKSKATASIVRYRIAQIGVRTESYVTKYPDFAPMKHVWGKYYIDGNVMEGNSTVTKDNWTKGVYEQTPNDSSVDKLFTQTTKDTIRLSAPLETNIVTTHTAKQALGRVILYAGCSKQRDIIDQRIAEETEMGTATYIGSVSSDAASKPGLIDLPDDVKPAGATSAWPELSDGGVDPADLKDSDNDGIPDVWEIANGLNPNRALDGKETTLSAEGYTNLEVYLNSLVADITEQQNLPIDYEPIQSTNLESLLSTAKAGDVLSVTSETINKELTIDKSVTIRAYPGLTKTPVLDRVTFKITNGASLSLEGVICSYDQPGATPTDSKYLITATTGEQAIDKISFKDCEIFGYGRGAVRADNVSNIATVKELIVDNCIFHDMCYASPNYSVLGFSASKLQKATIVNSSFYNNAGGVFVHNTHKDGALSALDFTMRNVTILNCGRDKDESDTSNAGRASNDIIATGAFDGSTYLIENCIINALPSKKVVLNNTASIRNSMITNPVTGSLTEDTRVDFSISEIDYSKFSMKTSLTATPNPVIGDPRWELGIVGSVNESAAEHTISVYANGNTVYVYGLENGARIEAYSFGGMLQAVQTVSGHEAELSLPAGLYILRVVSGNNSHVTKVKIR